MMIMWKPKYFQEMITKRVDMTISGSASQSCTKAPSPTASSVWSTSPSGVEHELEDEPRR